MDLKIHTFPEKMHISNSMINTFAKCKRLFFYSYVLRLKQKKTPKPFLLGTFFGQGLDEFYEKGSIDIQNIIDLYNQEVEKLFSYLQPEEVDSYEKQSAILEGLLTGYQNVYANDFKKYKYIAHEKEFSFPIVAVSNNVNRDYWYAGKIDLLLQNKKTGTDILVEHKTASIVDSRYIQKLSLDSQITGYILGAQSLGLKVKDIIYNINKKSRLRIKKTESMPEYINRIIDDYESRPHEHFFRENLKRSGAELKSFSRELEHKVIDIDFLINKADTCKSKDIKSLLPFFYKSESHCMNNFGACPYLEVCSGKGGCDEFLLNADFEAQELNPELSIDKTKNKNN